jgi:hypothetical protein
MGASAVDLLAQAREHFGQRVEFFYDETKARPWSLEKPLHRRGADSWWQTLGAGGTQQEAFDQARADRTKKAAAHEGGAQ